MTHWLKILSLLHRCCIFFSFSTWTLNNPDFGNWKFVQETHARSCGTFSKWALNLICKNNKHCWICWKFKQFEFWGQIYICSHWCWLVPNISVWLQCRAVMKLSRSVQSVNWADVSGWGEATHDGKTCQLRAEPINWIPHGSTWGKWLPSILLQGSTFGSMVARGSLTLLHTW